MRGYVIVLYTFAIYLVQGSHAFLPKFVYRVSKCPDPNNITEWEEASRKLVCLHPIRGGSSKQLSRVYHCLPSSFLNESVEYCGFSGAVTKGYCPVYSYGDGRNRAPTYRSCTNFTEGCPETQYHSKDVYMYPACLNINPIEKCYIAEPTCGKNYEIQDVTNITDISSTESDIEDDTNDNKALVGFICLLVIMAFSAVFVCILWKKKIIKCTVPTTAKDQQVDYDAVRQRASVGTGASGTNDDHLLQNNRREEADCDPLQQNGDVVREEETICNPLLPNGNTENPKDEKDEILHLNLDLFLEKVGRQITGKTLTKMKSHLKAKKNITESEMQMIDGIASGNDLINCLHRKYDFNINLYILQAILELTKEKRLATCCVKFAKNNRRMYYYEGHVNTRGYKEVILKLERNIEDYRKGDLECMRRHLLSLVNISHPEDIVFKEIAEGCIAIHVLVRQTFVDMIKSADLSSLHDHYVVEVNVIGECKRILGGTGEKHIQEALLFKERDVSLSCFEVSFEFGPIALTTHKRVADKLQQYRKTMGMLDARNDSVIIIHHTKSDVCDIMLELFESEPIIHEERKYTCVQNVDAVSKIVIFCCDKLSKNIVYQSLKDAVLEKECKENNFIFYMDNFEQTDIHYSDLLETKMDMEHVLQPRGDKSHLYNAYCACVEEEFKHFKKSVESSDLNDTKSFPEIFGCLEKLEEMLNTHNKKPQTNQGGKVKTKDYLRKMESCGAPGCMIGDTLWIFGHIPEEMSEEVLERSKLMKEIYNIDVVLSSITLYRFHSGGKMSNETHGFGSIGMFTTLRKLGIPRLVCTSSGHLCNENDTIYYEDGEESRILGTCIWPKFLQKPDLYLNPMSVVCLNEKVHSLVEKELREDIKIFDGELIELINRKVYKFGATSGHTVGYIEDRFEMSNNRGVIVARGKNDECFADEGDSGSIVLTKIGKDTVALGIVVGSIDMRTEDEPTGSVLVVSLKDALHQFAEHYDCEIENPFLLL